MHAIVGIFKMDRTKAAEQRVELHERIIPMVKQLPGLVAAYWSYDPETFRHYSHIVFETAEAARQLAAMVTSQARAAEASAAGVAIESLDVVEVIGEAHR
jgi:hypothetical protein